MKSLTLLRKDAGEAPDFRFCKGIPAMTRSVIAALLLFGCLMPVAGHSEVMKEDSAAMETSQSSAYRNRLPNNYGKLGLSDEQREQIYGIQADYRTRITALLDEVEELRNQQTLEIQEVLTSSQRDDLQAFIKEAQAKRAARKAASKS